MTTIQSSVNRKLREFANEIQNEMRISQLSNLKIDQSIILIVHSKISQLQGCLFVGYRRSAH